MKISPIKTGIGVIILFLLVLAGLFAYTPLKIKYYSSSLYSNDTGEVVHAVEKLLEFGGKGFEAIAEREDRPGNSVAISVLNTKQYPSKDMKVVMNTEMKALAHSGKLFEIKIVDAEEFNSVIIIGNREDVENISRKIKGWVDRGVKY